MVSLSAVAAKWLGCRRFLTRELEPPTSSKVRYTAQLERESYTIVRARVAMVGGPEPLVAAGTDGAASRVIGEVRKVYPDSLKTRTYSCLHIISPEDFRILT